MLKAAFVPLQSWCSAAPRSKTACAKCTVTAMSAKQRYQHTDEEQFDVINDDGTPLGFSKPRSLVHRHGDWHRSTHIWLLSKQGQVLVQLRSATKDTFPGRWDVSAAGHLSAGDKSEPSAIRELEEELGIRLKPHQSLHFLHSIKASATGATEKHGSYIDNEIQDIYIHSPKETIAIDSLTLQDEEVQCVEYWPWHVYRERCINNDQMLVPRSDIYKRIVFPLLDNLLRYE